ncbi:hypothetical protein B0H11DRAFT_326374 [Mycena galericulata]|nr:hypothetical protein B0H11DRAFT_326374 [Mycena galericulata]
MRFSIIASGAAAFVWLLFDTTLAVHVTSTNTVLIPGGYRANANLHRVSSGSRIAHVGSEIHVFDPNGTVVNVVTPSPATKTSAAVTPEETGWVTYANWLNTGTPIGSFGTTWTVPPVPATWHGQTLFLFNSIEPSTFDAIMQPVLQYGGSAAGGGEFWAVATWYLYGDNTFFTTPIAVNPGQVLNGGIQLVGTYNYLAQFTNVPGTAIEVDGGEQLTWATETLESYGVTETSDYPSGSTVFSDVTIILVNGDIAPVSWSTVNDPGDGLSTTVNANGGSNAVITIQY